MPNIIPIANISSLFFALDLRPGDDLYLAQGIVVASRESTAILGRDSNLIFCDGTAVGEVGVLAGDRVRLDVGETGRIFGFDVGVSSFGESGVIRNEGTITGGAIGVAQRDPAILHNSGTITAGTALSLGYNAAVFIDAKGETRLDNDGLIRAQKAGSFAFKSIQNSEDTIVNAGTMIGKIDLGPGDDLFDGSKGRVTGTIDGDAGDDVLIGSAFSDIFIGSSGKDTFVFKTALGPQNIDRITVYSVADDTIRLDNAVFKGLKSGKLSADAFKDITDPATKLDPEDRILYNRDTGRIYYDPDGNGSAQKVQFVTLDNDPTITHADFFVV